MDSVLDYKKARSKADSRIGKKACNNTKASYGWGEVVRVHITETDNNEEPFVFHYVINYAEKHMKIISHEKDTVIML